MARTLQQILDEITNRIKTDPEVAPYIDVDTPSKVRSEEHTSELQSPS